MNNVEIAKLASEYAKEITVAKMPTSRVETIGEHGKKVADFYTELYKGIYAVLKNDLETPKLIKSTE